MLKYSSVQSAAISSRTWCLTTTIPDRMELAGDKPYDEPRARSWASASIGSKWPQIPHVACGFRFSGSQNFSYLEGKLLQRERLGNQLDAGIEHAIVYDRVASIACRVENLQIRLSTLSLFGKLPPIHIWHDDVREQESQVGMLVEHAQCGSGAIYGDNGVTQFAQHIGRRLPNFFFIFDNENDLLCGARWDHIACMRLGD